MIFEAVAALPAWLMTHPAARTLLGLVQIALFGVLFFGMSYGTGKAVFALMGAATAALFWLSPWIQVIAIPLLLAGLIWISWRDRSRQRAIYQPASAIAEGGGIKRGLTVPETALVMDRPHCQAVTAVLVGLLKKGILKVKNISPLALHVAPGFRTREFSLQVHPRAAHRRATAQQHGVVLHPYEEPFLELLEQNDGQPLNAVDFTAPLRILERHTQERIKGYDREATQDYYRKHLGRARHDVLHIGEGSKGQQVRDHHMEWLVLDEAHARLYRHYRPAWLPEGESGVESLVSKISANLNSK